MSGYVTLVEARKLAGDDVDRKVIDQFLKSNFLFDNVPFHRAASPTEDGGVFVYTYTRGVTQPDAAFRALNSNYTASVSEVEQITTTCKVLGGRFAIDRAILAGGGGLPQVAYQMDQKVKGAVARFSHAIINGDEGDDANAFDGLSVALAGTSTEIDGSDFDWSDLSTQANAFSLLETLDDLIGEVSSTGTVTILGNKRSIGRIRTAARVAGYLTASESAAGRVIESYAGIPLVDLGAGPGTNDPVIGTTDGLTDLYVVNWASDGVHAVTPAGVPLVRTHVPNSDSEGVAPEGWVEMITSLAVKQTNAAAVLRGVRVAPEPVAPPEE